MFQQFIKRIGSKCEIADGKTFEYGSTRVKFSQPVPHGEVESELGYVLMTTVESGDNKFLHASDVQGPISKQTTRIILKENPDLLILGGPPVYLEGLKVDRMAIGGALDNAARIAVKVPTLIFEHHLLRSEDWRERAKRVWDAGTEVSHTVTIASEYLSEQPQLLEAVRPRLYEEEPPSEEFMKWSKMKREKQRIQLPPI